MQLYCVGHCTVHTCNMRHKKFLINFLKTMYHYNYSSHYQLGLILLNSYTVHSLHRRVMQSIASICIIVYIYVAKYCTFGVSQPKNL